MFESMAGGNVVEPVASQAQGMETARFVVKVLADEVEHLWCETV